MSQQLQLFETEFVNTAKKIKPRPFQRQAIDSAFAEYQKGHRGMICRSPTGSGKTITAGLLIERWLAENSDNRAMVLAHERQLVWQFAQELKDVLGFEPRVEMADNRVGYYEDTPCVVASRATLRQTMTDGEPVSRLYKFDATKNWLIVVDEAHRYSHKLRSCKHVFDWFGQNSKSWRFGITATPFRGDNVSLKHLFPSIVLDYRLVNLDGGPSAVADGYAVPYRQFFVRVESVDFTKLSEVAGDWKDDELERILSEQEVLAKLVEPTLDIVKGRRTLIFTPGVEMSRKVAGYINGKAGETTARALDGSVPDAVRADVYRQHQRGDFQFLVVCGLCREGYNDPGIGAVAVFRPTKSKSLAEQMKGRGCRPLRGTIDGLDTASERREAIANSAKPDCLIVDLVGVTGLGGSASTADIYAQSLPEEHAEEIIAKANAALCEATESQNVEEVVRKSRDEVLADIAERKRRHEEEEAKQQAEWKARARLGASAEWTAREVQEGGGGVIRDSKGKIVRPATEGQINLIRKRGIQFDPSCLTFGVASRVIGQIMKGVSNDQIKRTNRLFPSKKVAR